MPAFGTFAVHRRTRRAINANSWVQSPSRRCILVPIFFAPELITSRKPGRAVPAIGSYIGSISTPNPPVEGTMSRRRSRRLHPLPKRSIGTVPRWHDLKILLRILWPQARTSERTEDTILLQAILSRHDRMIVIDVFRMFPQERLNLSRPLSLSPCTCASGHFLMHHCGAKKDNCRLLGRCTTTWTFPGLMVIETEHPDVTTATIGSELSSPSDLTSTGNYRPSHLPLRRS